MESKNRVLVVLRNLDLVVGGIALAALVVLTFSGVIMRYAFSQPFTWLEEVQLWCMVWIVYITAGAAFRTGSHVAIEMVVDMFPVKLQKVMEVLISIVVVVVIAYLFVQSVGFVNLFLMNGRTTNMLSVPFALIYGIVPISAISMLFNFFYAAWHEYKRLGTKREVGE
ncbi:TRAP transporter small permease [Anaerotalea alkaliphila]|uniref:TRAP transporter small permease n=1 Tax=Anaerotalea alkaliphila TaxID=2662126 RepID=A0A7X5HUE7_9FIRM|nr:TRAP transporter small permease [Anaerotalea alkaliphila]NDL66852.1 TRAP transporter small permease [Anaerotalea alkaliphila]